MNIFACNVWFVYGIFAMVDFAILEMAWFSKVDYGYIKGHLAVIVTEIMLSESGAPFWLTWLWVWLFQKNIIWFDIGVYNTEWVNFFELFQKSLSHAVTLQIGENLLLARGLDWVQWITESLHDHKITEVLWHFHILNVLFSQSSKIEYCWQIEIIIQLFCYFLKYFLLLV